jgi:Zn finger protein HypA/HybF involved in hydrogenase expression
MFDDVPFECLDCGKIMLQEEFEYDSEHDEDAPSCPECGSHSMSVAGDAGP